MNLFGCKFCEQIGDEVVCDRKNFDSLLWATVTVFQVSEFTYKWLLKGSRRRRRRRPPPHPPPPAQSQWNKGEGKGGSDEEAEDDTRIPKRAPPLPPGHHSSPSRRPQILTQEDWNIVLFQGMKQTSHWAALYFVALMTFGNYVLFNLLVAILVEGFSNQVRLPLLQAAIDRPPSPILNTSQFTLSAF